MKKIVLLFVLLLPGLVVAENDTVNDMDNTSLEALIKRIDEKVEGKPGFWRLQYDQHELYVVTDEKADRMRIMIAVDSADELSTKLQYRLLQANFDAALDARYAVGKGTLWGVFIHPLSSLTEYDFFSGLAQTVMLKVTYGSTFSSGVLLFGGGDSEEQQRQYYKAIMEKAKAI